MFQGYLDAGESVSDGEDGMRNIKIISLYGKHKKPSNRDLSDVDIVVFDIQDVGVRFYTYLSTLHYVMESVAENGLPIVVLDRPNPNGARIDGEVLNFRYKSFIGLHPVPILYGMTIGEYAEMIKLGRKGVGLNGGNSLRAWNFKGFIPSLPEFGNPFNYWRIIPFWKG